MSSADTRPIFVTYLNQRNARHRAAWATKYFGGIYCGDIRSSETQLEYARWYARGMRDAQRFLRGRYGDQDLVSVGQRTQTRINEGDAGASPGHPRDDEESTGCLVVSGGSVQSAGTDPGAGSAGEIPSTPSAANSLATASRRIIFAGSRFKRGQS